MEATVWEIDHGTSINFMVGCIQINLSKISISIRLNIITLVNCYIDRWKKMKFKIFTISIQSNRNINF